MRVHPHDDVVRRCPNADVERRRHAPLGVVQQPYIALGVISLELFDNLPGRVFGAPVYKEQGNEVGGVGLLEQIFRAGPNV